jgi:hypothetical protein
VSGAHYESANGPYVAYQTEATDLAHNLRDANGVTDVVRSNLRGGRVTS